MRRVLLINPWIYDFTAFDFWLKPLGMLYVAGTLEKYGYKVYLIDCLYRHDPDFKEFLRRGNYTKFDDESYGVGHFFNEVIEKPDIFRDIPRYYKRYGLPLDIFYQKLQNIPKPDVIGITSGMTYWYPGVFKAIEIIKEKFKGVSVVLGGIYATLCYEHAVKKSGADYIIRGPGELAMLKLVDQICGIKRDYSDFPSSINTMPFPAYNLYPYLSSVSVIASLGCPLRCSYCASSVLQPKFRYRDATSFIKELEIYTNRNISDVAFYDDALLWKHQRFVDEILSKIIEKNFRVRFHTPNGIHAKEVDINLARKLFQANFKTLNIGLETTDEEHQKTISSGKVTNEEFERCVRNLKQAGFGEKNLKAYVMIGLPEQSVEEIINTFEFVYKLDIRFYVSQFSPVPGTVEFKKAVELYGLDPTEPLNTNKTAYPLRHRVISFEIYEKIRNFAKFLNKNLGKRLNVKLEAKKFGILS
ncbi:MAG: B12-binding domain-containing radical SAM protein [Planctomycetota bacterium]